MHCIVLYILVQYMELSYWACNWACNVLSFKKRYVRTVAHKDTLYYYGRYGREIELLPIWLLIAQAKFNNSFLSCGIAVFVGRFKVTRTRMFFQSHDSALTRAFHIWTPVLRDVSLFFVTCTLPTGLARSLDTKFRASEHLKI